MFTEFTAPKNSIITSDLIKAAIAFNESRRSRYNRLEDYYLGKHDIMSRPRPEVTLKNNKVMINHAKYITDINVGYLLGNPVEYQATDEQDIDPVLEVFKEQSMSDADHEIAKDISKFGLQYELIYAGEDSKPHRAEIDVRNCVIVYDDTVQHEKLFALTYDLDKSENAQNKYMNVKTYDKEVITDWTSVNDGNFASNTKAIHFFTKVPVIAYRNNPEGQGDFEQQMTLIDAYNLLQSDRVNDKEQLVDSILLLYGMDMTPEQKELLKEFRMMSNIDTNAKVEYLTKTLDETEADVLRKVLEQDIFKASMTPNMTDENFVGNASGVAIRFKLLPFEQSVSNKQRYFEKGLKERFELYNIYLNTSTSTQVKLIPIYEVDAVFKRNLPQNDYETSQMILNLDGLVSKETLVGQLSFIIDASEEVETAATEKQDELNVMQEQFGTNQPSVTPNNGATGNTDPTNKTQPAVNGKTTNTK